MSVRVQCPRQRRRPCYSYIKRIWVVIVFASLIVSFIAAVPLPKSAFSFFAWVT